MSDIAEIHELLESVRVTLASSMNPDREQLERLHNELDAEIRVANKRLRECDALLADGHRSEAIQLAEQEPNLLEVVSILDFPELPEWNDFVAELGLTVTPELQIDIATDLNSAYDEDEPLEKLLRKFRVYSLGRAPLRSRIDLLRQIAKRDEATSYWKDDLKSYEQVRLRQMVDEVREATGSKNHADIRRLHDELHRKSWSVKPDRKLIERIDQFMNDVRQQDAVERLADLSDELRTARKNEDADTVKSMIGQWEELAQKCNQNSTAFEHLKAAVKPVYDWLSELGQQEEDEKLFANEVKKLQKILRSDQSTLDQIYRQYDVLESFEQFKIPEAVQSRFEARLAEIDKQQKNKQMMTIGGIAVGVIVLLIIAAKLIF